MAQEARFFGAECSRGPCGAATPSRGWYHQGSATRTRKRGLGGPGRRGGLGPGQVSALQPDVQRSVRGKTRAPVCGPAA